jgi:hypothetical protein
MTVSIKNCPLLEMMTISVYNNYFYTCLLTNVMKMKIFPNISLLDGNTKYGN